MPEFQHINYLTGLIIILPLIVFFLLVIRWKKKVKKQIGDPELVDALIKDHSPKNYSYKFLLVLIALALCIIKAASKNH